MKKFGFYAIIVVFVLFVASSSSFSSQTEELEGTLEIIMATEVAKKTCEPLYFINVNGKRTQFSLPVRVPPLSPGQKKIKIAGRWEEVSGKKSFHCRKVESVSVAPTAKKAVSSADSVSDYLPKQDQDPVLGPQRTLVILLRFTDHNTPEWGKEKAENKVFSSEPTDKYPNDHSDNAFLKECSGNETWLAGECSDGWKDMPYPATDYGYGGDDERLFFSKLKTDAIKAADPYVNYLLYDHLLFVRTGNGWKYDFSTLGKGEIKTDDGEATLSYSFVLEDDITDLGRDYVAHELIIHGTLGLVHANNVDISTGEINGYGDEWDTRGTKFVSFALIDCLHKYMAGLLNINQVALVESSGEYWLDQRELGSSGTKLLVIFLGYGNYGEPILYYLEYFKELGEFDSQVFDEHNPNINKDTVLLRKYESKRGGDSEVYVTNGKEWDNIKALDMKSSEFCDSDYENLEHYGVCVQVLEKIGTDANSQAKVKITLTENYSFPTPISPTPSPTPEPTPTPSPSSTPTLEPTPSPTPTPALGEMVLTVSLNKKTVRRGSKARVKMEVKNTDGSFLQADKISCQMTRNDGTWLYAAKRGISKARFNFKIKPNDPAGRYKISATASKENYLDATVEKFFEVK